MSEITMEVGIDGHEYNIGSSFVGATACEIIKSDAMQNLWLNTRCAPASTSQKGAIDQIFELVSLYLCWVRDPS